MADEHDPVTRRGRLAAAPRRARGAVVRVLRQPTATTERFDEVFERLATLEDDLRERHASLLDEVAALARAVGQLQTVLADQQALTTDAWRQLGSTTAALVAQAALADLGAVPEAGERPLVSIVLPVQDRPVGLRRAVESVLAQTYPHWELLIVDDASVVSPRAGLGALLSDARIQLLQGDGLGVAAARNLAIAAAHGEIVTFLDSDNWWFPRRLEELVRWFGPESSWAIDQQLVLSAGPLPHHVRDTEKPLASLAEANFIDLGSVAVRRARLEELHLVPTGAATGGPFDTELKRLSDWDLVQRLATRGEPRRIPLVGHVYDEQDPGRLSAREPFGPAYHRIRSRGIGRPAAGLRILVSEWHFPHVTETYIQSDIVGLQALGAEIEVWSDEGVSVPYEPGVPWRRGPLEDHIASFQPHLVLTHWLHIGLAHRAVTRPLGLPHAVRCHGFDHDEGIVELLANDPGVVVHLFPHLLGRFGDRPNVVADPVAFDPQRIAPTGAKDRRLVLRLSAGLHTKDLETFVLTASRCPEHRFVLGVGHTYQVEERTEEIAQMVADLRAPVEILTDLGYEKAARLTMDAGIYQHTHGTSHVLGMPISPVEAMASGSLVLCRDLPGADYLGDGALLYRGATPDARADHAAALINDTLQWSDERWADQARLALDRAWTRHPADLVAHDLLTTWRTHLGVGARVSG